MPKYKIHRSYGYVGTDSYEVIEASDQQDVRFKDGFSLGLAGLGLALSACIIISEVF